MPSSPPSSPSPPRALVSDPDMKPIDVDHFDGDNNTPADSRTIDLTGSDAESPEPARHRATEQSIFDVDGQDGHQAVAFEQASVDHTENDDMVDEVESPMESVVEGEEEEAVGRGYQEDMVAEEDVVVEEGDGNDDDEEVEVEAVDEDEVIEFEPAEEEREERDVGFVSADEGEGEGEGEEGKDMREVGFVKVEEIDTMIEVRVKEEEGEGVVGEEEGKGSGEEGDVKVGGEEEEENVQGRAREDADSVGEDGVRFESVESDVREDEAVRDAWDGGNGGANADPGGDGERKEVNDGKRDEGVAKDGPDAEVQKDGERASDERNWKHNDSMQAETEEHGSKSIEKDEKLVPERETRVVSEVVQDVEEGAKEVDLGDINSTKAAQGDREAQNKDKERGKENSDDLSTEKTAKVGEDKGKIESIDTAKVEGSNANDASEEGPAEEAVMRDEGKAAKDEAVAERTRTEKSGETAATDLAAVKSESENASEEKHVEERHEDVTSLAQQETDAKDRTDKYEIKPSSTEAPRAFRSAAVESETIPVVEVPTVQVEVIDEGNASQETKLPIDDKKMQQTASAIGSDAAQKAEQTKKDDTYQESVPTVKDDAAQKTKPAMGNRTNQETASAIEGDAIQAMEPVRGDVADQDVPSASRVIAAQEAKLATEVDANRTTKDVPENEAIVGTKSDGGDVEMSTPITSGNKEAQDVDMAEAQSEDQAVSASESPEADETDKEESEAEDVVMKSDIDEPSSAAKSSQPADAAEIVDVTAAATPPIGNTSTAENENLRGSVQTDDGAGGAVPAKNGSPGSADRNLIQTSTQDSPSSNLTSPMFGINPPRRSVPVSFSSPPSFHRPTLNPNAKPFTPAAAASKKGASGLSSPVPTAGKEPQEPASSFAVSTAANSAKPLVEAQVKSADVKPVDTQHKAVAPFVDSKEEKSSQSDKQETSESKSDKVKLSTEDQGKRVKYEQKLRRVPAKGTSGGMVYCVENVSISVKRGSGRPSRRPLLSTIELVTIPNGESKMEFSDSRSNPKSVWLSLSSVKDNVKVKKVTNKPNIMSVTVLGPSGLDTGIDAAKYFLHLNKNTFQVFYDATLKFLLDFVIENPRPSVVKFTEPPEQERRASSAPARAYRNAPKPIAAKAQKVDSENQKRLLLEKMEALKKKKAERVADPSPSRETSGLTKSKGRLKQLAQETGAGKSRVKGPPPKPTLPSASPSATLSNNPTSVPSSAGGSAPTPRVTKGSVSAPSSAVGSVSAPSSAVVSVSAPSLAKGSASAPSFASKAADATGMTTSLAKKVPEVTTTRVAAPSKANKASTPIGTNANISAQPQKASGILTGKQNPTSPKKRPAFRPDDQFEQVKKKARLNLPEKHSHAAQDDMGAEKPRGAMHSLRGENARSSVAPGSEVANRLGSITSAPKDKVRSGVVESNMAARGLGVVRTSKVEKSPMTTTGASDQHRAESVILPAVLKKKLDSDAKRLTELLATVESMTKENEQNTGESKLSLQRCDPTSVQDFFDRLYTFQPSTWIGYGREHVLSPIECARRGWFNSGPSRLASSEGAEIIAKFENCENLEAFAKEEERVRSQVLGQGHELLSGWIGKSCPEEFKTLSGSKKVLSSDELKAHAKCFVASKAISFLDKGRVNWEEHPDFLKGREKSVKLAVFNWSVVVIDDEEVDVRCNWCDRSVALADESLIGRELARGVEFSLRESHHPYCPFNMDEKAVLRNAEAFGIVDLGSKGHKDTVGRDNDAQMVDV